MFEARNCLCCGKGFIPQSNAQHYCDRECREEHNRIRSRENRRKKREALRKARLRKLSLNEFTAEAKKLGMSYGQYDTFLRKQRGEI